MPYKPCHISCAASSSAPCPNRMVTHHSNSSHRKTSLCPACVQASYIKHFFSAGNVLFLLILLQLSIGYTGANQRALRCQDDRALCAGGLARYVSGCEEASSVLQQRLDCAHPDRQCRECCEEASPLLQQRTDSAHADRRRRECA